MVAMITKSAYRGDKKSSLTQSNDLVKEKKIIEINFLFWKISAIYWAVLMIAH